MALPQLYDNPLRKLAGQSADIVGKKQGLQINAMKMAAMENEKKDAGDLKAAWDAAGGDLNKFMETQGYRFSPQQNMMVKAAYEKKQALAAQRGGFQDYATGGAFSEGQQGPTQGAAQAMQAYDLGGGGDIAAGMVGEMYPGKADAEWKALPTGKGLYNPQTGDTKMFPAGIAAEDESYTYKPGADGFMWKLPKGGGEPQKTGMKVPVDDDLVKVSVEGPDGKPVTKMVPKSALTGEGIATYERERKPTKTKVRNMLTGKSEIMWLDEGQELPPGYDIPDRTPADIQKWDRIRAIEEKENPTASEVEEATNLRAKMKMGTKKTWSTTNSAGEPVLKMMNFETGEDKTIMSGERVAFTNAERTAFRKEYVAQLDQVTRLGEISELYKPEFSNYWQRGEAGVLSFLDKSFPDPEVRDLKRQEYYEWRRGVEESFNSYRKIVTGAQASDAELVKLSKAFLTAGMSKDQFEAHMRGIMSMATMELKRNEYILENHKMPTLKQSEKFMRDGREAGTRVTYQMIVGEPLSESTIEEVMKEEKTDRVSAIKLIQDSLY